MPTDPSAPDNPIPPEGWNEPALEEIARKAVANYNLYLVTPPETAEGERVKIDAYAFYQAFIRWITPADYVRLCDAKDAAIALISQQQKEIEKLKSILSKVEEYASEDIISRDDMKGVIYDIKRTVSDKRNALLTDAALSTGEKDE